MRSFFALSVLSGFFFRDVSLSDLLQTVEESQRIRPGLRAPIGLAKAPMNQDHLEVLTAFFPATTYLSQGNPEIMDFQGFFIADFFLYFHLFHQQPP